MMRYDVPNNTNNNSDEDVIKSILEMNTSSKSVVGFRSYSSNDDSNDQEVDHRQSPGSSSSITATANGGGGQVVVVTTTPAPPPTTPDRVLNHYRNMRTYQTVEFHNRMMQKYTFDNGNYRYVRRVFSSQNNIYTSPLSLSLSNVMNVNIINL